MNKFTLVIVSFLLFGCRPPVSAVLILDTGNPEITAEEISDHIKFLASDELKGRFPGTAESQKGLDYIIKLWESEGVEPAGTAGYKQTFDFVSSLTLGENNSLTVGEKAFTIHDDFIPLGFSGNGELTAGIVFVGYGFSIDDSISWDDYQGVDVEGKWVLILQDGPAEDNLHTPFAPHLAPRKKTLVARDHNAAGILFVSKDAAEEDVALIELRYDYSFSGAGIPVLHISPEVANYILQSSGNTLNDLQTRIDSTQAPASVAVSGIEVSARVNLVTTTVKATNLIGLIRSDDPVFKDEYIVLGAHFDHLGMGGPGSGTTHNDTVAIHNGADDNASGTAGILEIGQKLAANRDQLKRSVLLVCFDAEEKGTLGSKHFVKNPVIDLKNIVTMINLDMVGRMSENKLVIGGTGTSPLFKMILGEFNRVHQLDLKMSEDGYGPSDHSNFYMNDIPVLFFFSGTHEDYHKPSDDWERINTAGEKKIADFVYDVTSYLSQRDERPQFAEAGPKEPKSSVRGFKVTFGIIPGYGSQEEGLEIEGTKKGGPAAKAGMLKGDIIIAIKGKEVKDIHDYMYRLSELKKGQTVEVKVKRGEETIILSLDL